MTAKQWERWVLLQLRAEVHSEPMSKSAIVVLTGASDPKETEVANALASLVKSGQASRDPQSDRYGITDLGIRRLALGESLFAADGNTDLQGRLWSQARGELRGFAASLDRRNAGITADQIRMAVAWADQRTELLAACKAVSEWYGFGTWDDRTPWELIQTVRDAITKADGQEPIAP